MAHPAPILIVDDEPDLLHLLDINLRKEGFETAVASNGSQALALVDSTTFACILLDLMLPDISGTELCRRIRSKPETADVPIIIVSARDEEIDRVVGFEVGADDYVVKANMSIRELVLRIRAVIRRHGSQPQPAVVEQEKLFETGLLKVDFSGHRLWVEDEEVHLTATEFKLLTMLVQHPGRVQTRGNLLQQVWDMPSDLNTRTVDTHVKRLREKLRVTGAYIETVRGVGYRFRNSKV